MPKTVYVCEGSCKGIATEEQWKSGAKKCGAKDCELYGKPLQKRFKCEMCSLMYSTTTKHACTSKKSCC